MVRPIFEAWLEPFADMGASTITIRNTGGTDHLSFDAVGLPGFQFIQDPIEYGTRTHHSNMDIYDHISKARSDAGVGDHGDVRLQHRAARRDAAPQAAAETAAPARRRPSRRWERPNVRTN